MASYVICAVRDQAVKAFNNPMFFRTVDEARRSFGDAVADPKNTSFSMHAPDYSLWQIGTWDDNGTLVAGEPTCLMQAVDCIPSIT